MSTDVRHHPRPDDTGPRHAAARQRRLGVGLAGITACVSGVAVFVNGYGVRRAPDPTTYTTAKNLMAALVLVAFVAAGRAVGSPGRFVLPTTRRARVELGLVAVLGGSVPFVLFFEGLARATSTDAAFVHKTLVVWVAVLAVPLLAERIGPVHVAAIGLLVAGQAALAGGPPSLRPGTGEALILAATLMWSVEVVLAKHLLRDLPPLTVGTARMGGGVALLLAWAAVRGELTTLAGLDARTWAWASLTGTLLAAYVATWYGALARAQAIDVTAVLVAGAVVTASLDHLAAGGARPPLLGVALVLTGTAIVAARATRTRPVRIPVTVR